MASPRSIMARDDTLLGICFAIGQDFGFNPLYLRILFAIILFRSPVGAFAGYAILGAIVAFSRWAVPGPLPAEDSASGTLEWTDEPCEELPLAA